MKKVIHSLNGVEILKNRNNQLSCELMDVEGDVFEVDFNYDGCANIHFDGMAFMNIESWKLITLGELVEWCDEWYEKGFSKNKEFIK